MTSKQCFKCKKTLPLDMFYKHPKMADGRVNKCKECNKKDVRDNRLLRSEYYREYEKGRANRPDRVKARLDYSKTDAGKLAGNRAKKNWTNENIIQRSAAIIIGNAVRDKKIIKPKHCSKCGEEKKRIEGHHCDYSKPLEVIWFCSKCHRDWHINNKAINCD